MSNNQSETIDVNKVKLEYRVIADLIPSGSSVLDLGCGDGSLLRYLRETRGVRGYGVEISDANIAACIANNVNVIQNDLESGIADFEDQSFDFVILSQTLQATRHTEALMKEIVRVGREGIVSFPNFGYWKNRLQVLSGNMPVSDELPYQWYDTPNVHLCTLDDFEILSAHLHIRILGRHVMANGRDVLLLPNLLGSTAVYRFRRDA
jgi:methionine biosynthesis protein MetW